MGVLLDIRLLAVVAALLALGAVVAVRCPQWTLPGAGALGVLLSRPSAIGERIPGLGPAVLLAVALACVVEGLRRRSRDVGVTPWPFILFAAAWVWLGLHRLINPLAEPTLVTSTVTVLVPVLVLYAVVRDPELLQRTRTALVALVVAISALVVVALALVLVAGPSATFLGAVPLGYAGDGAGLYLPGALSYGVDPSAAFPRMLVIGREPGMGALMVGWAFFAMPEGFPGSRWWRAVLVIAMLGTQSTAGIGLFGVCLVLQAVLGRRKFSPTAAALAVVGGAAAVYLAVFDPSFGLLSKVDSTGASFSDRNQATLNGLTALTTHPFDAATTAPLSSVNLVAAIAVNGAPWALLTLAVLLAPVLRARRRDPLRWGSLFVVLIMLTSQPLAGNAGVLLLAVIAYYAAEPSRRSAPAHRADPEPAGSVVGAAP